MMNMLKLPHNNTVAKILSVIMAFALWLYVMNEQNPPMAMNYVVNLEKRNLQSQLFVLDAPENVRVRVRGPRAVVSALSANEITAFVDLQGVQKGDYTKQVFVSVPRDLQVANVLPNDVIIRIDSFLKRSMSVETRVVGQIPSYLNLDELILAPSYAKVSGPSSAVTNVARIVAPINVDKSNTKGEIKVNSKLLAVDQNNVVVEKVVVEPESIVLTARFSEKVTTTSVPVKILVRGNLLPGFRLVSIKTNPEKVELTGTMNALKDLNELVIDGLNVDGLSKNTIRKVALRLPEGVTAKPELVDVFINVVEKKAGE